MLCRCYLSDLWLRASTFRRRLTHGRGGDRVGKIDTRPHLVYVHWLKCKCKFQSDLVLSSRVQVGKAATTLNAHGGAVFV